MFSHFVRGPGFIEVGTAQVAKLDDVKVDDGVEDEDEPEDGRFFSPW